MKKENDQSNCIRCINSYSFAEFSVYTSGCFQPNESTLSVESASQLNLQIKQVDGVFVHNGIATVTRKRQLRKL